jgi:hypothetical protein
VIDTLVNIRYNELKKNDEEMAVPEVGKPEKGARNLQRTSQPGDKKESE